MNRNRHMALLASGAALVLPTAAHAQDLAGHAGFVRIGQTWSHLADQGDVYSNGAFAPGSDYTTNVVRPLTLTAGWFLTNKIAIEASIAEEAETHNYPGGSLTGLPDLGMDAFQTTSASITWHPMRGQRFSPYVGGGYVYQNTTDNTDGFGQNFRIEDSHGPMLQGGVDVELTDRLGVFVDFKKAWYRADGSGILLGAPLYADSKLDPVSVQAGFTVRFGPERPVTPLALSGAGKWLMRAGVARLELDDTLALTVSGAPFAGATLATEPHWTPVVQVGRRLTDNFAVVATVGLPPENDASGGGTAAAFGKLAEVQYGPSALTVQYQPWTDGWFRPYVGVGATYMIIFSTRDSILTDVEMEDDIAPVVELGADVMVADGYGFFVEYKRGWLETRATGNVSLAVPGLGGAAVVGDAKIG
ncbi:MAG: OmpW/AlkL family protein, partial [Hyphomicrobium sp.]